MAQPWPDRAPAPVYLHIGGPSTGTTYLQRLMTANERTLADAGHLLAGRSWSDVVLAVHDALGTAQDPAMKQAARGRWERLAGEVLAHRGRGTVVSMEFLCWASPEAAARIVASLAGAEVHVVLTVRDTAAVLRSQWQTNCRNGAPVPLPRMIRALRHVVENDGAAGQRAEKMVDRALGVPRVLDTWVPLVGRGRVHVVTVPLRSSDPDLLWKRFAGVIGVDPALCTERAVESNTSLGHPSSELMRLLNLRIGPVPRQDYVRTMKSLLARDVLGARAHLEPKVTLNRPGRNHSARWNAKVRTAVEASGVPVVGSLDDLPTTLVGDEVPLHLAEPTDDELLAAAAWARDGLDEATASLERQVAGLRAAGADAADTGDEPRDDEEAAAAGDGEQPDDDGGDDPALARQLARRSPEVGTAVEEVAVRAERALALGSELARLRRTRGRQPRRPRLT
ncbi:hypothetical protein [Nocardioides sp. TF02-7]|uniref:hypothetical protein n=1 Tax=Nocardioides sp. TF02-7 TaxID=2917724 RepID=UPI001F05444E|nr:hypothetical protein [Nocardioides sp. TF02-7]UMG93196.1 hypothetical protein MF408_02510 [Nocardioides sp. TF02-7]